MERVRGLGLDELIADGLKVPHIGWSPVHCEKESRLADRIENETPFYFVTAGLRLLSNFAEVCDATPTPA
jgi:hypothetical protein